MGRRALDNKISPLHIAIALQYYNSPKSEMLAYSNHDNDVVAQVCHELHDYGLLEIADDNAHWQATEAMRLYIETLCQVPLPIRRSKTPPNLTSQLEATLQNRRNSDGDDTIKTRTAKIAAVIDEYVATTPQVRL